MDSLARQNDHPALTGDDHLRLIETWSGVLLDAAADNLRVEVPSCPGWQLRHLVHHMGNMALFVNAVIDAAGPEPEFTDAALPADSEACAWAAGEVNLLLARLRTLEPDHVMWNWSRAPRHAAFWPRCLAHEALVHAWDALDALGRRTKLPADACLDGVGEILEIHLPLRTGPIMASRWEAVVRTADEAASGAAWVAEIGHAEVRLVATTREETAGRVPDVLLSGSPEQLYLGLWGRTPLPLVYGAPDRAQALVTG